MEQLFFRNLSTRYMRYWLAVIIFILCTSPVMAQVPGSITLTSPVSATTGATPTFTWNEAVGAGTWYKLYLKSTTGDYKLVQWFETSDNSALYPQAICTGGLCSATITTELATDSYTWYVHGWNNDGNGPWSDTGTFSVSGNDRAPDECTIVAPINKTRGASPTLIWTEDPLATWYKLYVENDIDGTKVVQWYEVENNTNGYPEAACEEGNCSAQLRKSLNQGNHTWYVMGWNNYGNGDWSDAAIFDVTDQEVMFADTGNSEYVAVGVSTEGETLLTTEDGAKSVYSIDGQSVVVYSEDGLPQKGEIDGTIVLFENYTSSTVDLAFILSDGSVTYNRNVALPTDAQRFEENIATTTKGLSDAVFSAIQLAAAGIQKFFDILENAIPPQAVDITIVAQAAEAPLLTTVIEADDPDTLSGDIDDIGGVVCGHGTSGSECVSDSVDETETKVETFDENLDENSPTVSQAGTNLVFEGDASHDPPPTSSTDCSIYKDIWIGADHDISGNWGIYGWADLNSTPSNLPTFELMASNGATMATTTLSIVGDGTYWGYATANPKAVEGKTAVWTTDGQTVSGTIPSGSITKLERPANLQVIGGTNANPVISWDSTDTNIEYFRVRVFENPYSGFAVNEYHYHNPQDTTHSFDFSTIAFEFQQGVSYTIRVEGRQFGTQLQNVGCVSYNVYITNRSKTESSYSY
ncbi:MAG: hypothetical protein GY729_16140 [Desulfobacteraceae bacterium]|nr:hypothetical protein [Desulfobacteraceae bacterium]